MSSASVAAMRPSASVEKGGTSRSSGNQRGVIKVLGIAVIALTVIASGLLVASATTTGPLSSNLDSTKSRRDVGSTIINSDVDSNIASSADMLQTDEIEVEHSSSDNESKAYSLKVMALLGSEEGTCDLGQEHATAGEKIGELAFTWGSVALGHVTGGLSHFATSIIEVFWPKDPLVVNKAAVWDCIKDMVAEYVEDVIDKEKLKMLSKMLDGIMRSIKTYENAMPQRDTGHYAATREGLDTMFPYFTDDEQNGHKPQEVLPMLSDFGSLYLNWIKMPLVDYKGCGFTGDSTDQKAYYDNNRQFLLETIKGLQQSMQKARDVAISTRMSQFEIYYDEWSCSILCESRFNLCGKWEMKDHATNWYFRTDFCNCNKGECVHNADSKKWQEYSTNNFYNLRQSLVKVPLTIHLDQVTKSALLWPFADPEFAANHTIKEVAAAYKTSFIGNLYQPDPANTRTDMKETIVGLNVDNQFTDYSRANITKITWTQVTQKYGSSPIMGIQLTYNNGFVTPWAGQTMESYNPNWSTNPYVSIPIEQKELVLDADEYINFVQPHMEYSHRNNQYSTISGIHLYTSKGRWHTIGAESQDGKWTETIDFTKFPFPVWLNGMDVKINPSHLNTINEAYVAAISFTFCSNTYQITEK
eukprot:Colp12_sorted_trinity150504_noHs@35600